MLSIFAISSSLHQGTDVDSPDSFIEGLGVDYSFKGSDFSSYGEDLSIIYVMTGGTEGVFRDLLPWLLEKTRQTVLLLASDHSNSLAASVEILSYLRQRRIRGEILHGKPSYIRSRPAAEKDKGRNPAREAFVYPVASGGSREGGVGPQTVGTHHLRCDRRSIRLAHLQRGGQGGTFGTVGNIHPVYPDGRIAGGVFFSEG